MIFSYADKPLANTHDWNGVIKSVISSSAYHSATWFLMCSLHCRIIMLLGEYSVKKQETTKARRFNKSQRWKFLRIPTMIKMKEGNSVITLQVNDLNSISQLLVSSQQHKLFISHVAPPPTQKEKKTIRIIILLAFLCSKKMKEHQKNGSQFFHYN